MEFQRISIDPQVCEGKATVKDTRMTVEFVLRLLGAGYTAHDVIREYPILERADVYECASYEALPTLEGAVAEGFIATVDDTRTRARRLPL